MDEMKFADIKYGMCILVQEALQVRIASAE